MPAVTYRMRSRHGLDLHEACGVRYLFTFGGVDSEHLELRLSMDEG
jgi:transposase-like protein